MFLVIKPHDIIEAEQNSHFISELGPQYFIKQKFDAESGRHTVLTTFARAALILLNFAWLIRTR
jgi:hypothetical protein